MMNFLRFIKALILNFFSLPKSVEERLLALEKEYLVLEKKIEMYIRYTFNLNDPLVYLSFCLKIKRLLIIFYVYKHNTVYYFKVIKKIIIFYIFFKD